MVSLLATPTIRTPASRLFRALRRFHPVGMFKRIPLRLAPIVLAVLLVAAIPMALVVDRTSTSPRSPAGTGSGVAATQARSFPPFTGVDLTGENDVVVHVGARQSVIVHGDTNLLRRVTTRVHSGSLVIGTTPGNLNAKTPMFVAVSVPSLDALTLQGDGNIRVTGISGPSLTVGLSGNGDIEAAGTTTRLDVMTGGVGTAFLGQLLARDSKAALNGNGSIVVTATHTLDASVSGNGTIFYAGNPPHVTTQISGDGTITGDGTLLLDRARHR
jgi:hypothetical protein